MKGATSSKTSRSGFAPAKARASVQSCRQPNALRLVLRTQPRSTAAGRTLGLRRRAGRAQIRAVKRASHTIENDKLLKCIKCGHEVSISARSCPNCRSERFYGVMCYICWERLDERDALQIGGTYDGDDLIPFHYHKACLDKHFPPSASIRCQDCGATLPSLSTLQIVKREVICSQCGSRLPLGNSSCGDCRLPMVPGMHETTGGKRPRDAHRLRSRHTFCEQYRRTQDKMPSAGGGCLSSFLLLVLLAIVIAFRV